MPIEAPKMGAPKMGVLGDFGPLNVIIHPVAAPRGASRGTCPGCKTLCPGCAPAVELQ